MDIQYPISKEEFDDLEKRFAYHAPQGDQPGRYGENREYARKLAVVILRNCPPSRERSLALTNLEQAMFWANASIARNEKGDAK